ncbi:unnamed protein product [Diatraea saccharalis]|uniref:FP protein C-terminal domain-containing protein n=1 Tax=Diatraea saccharalis TaxID=40085 RepID=A0A9N9R0T2_9NEOP|nr:unnamed protein product [Diatraea saccharalis]
MPRVNRSPPRLLTSDSLLPQITHCKSDSNLPDCAGLQIPTNAPALCREATSDPNLALRKRKRGDEVDKDEIIAMFAMLKKEQEERFSALMNKIETGIKAHTDQNSAILSSIEFLGQKYDELVTRIDTLEREKIEDSKQIKLLEARLEHFERFHRISSIEVRNVPKTSVETKTDLLNLVQKVGTALSVPLQAADIRDVYRINTRKDTNQPIVAELTSVILRDKIISNVKTHNKLNSQNKFSTSNIKLDGPQKPIFISENLAPQTKKLFFLARETAKEFGYKYCWTSRGKVYMRRTDGAPFVRVNNEGDLEKVKSK